MLLVLFTFKLNVFNFLSASMIEEGVLKSVSVIVKSVFVNLSV